MKNSSSITRKVNLKLKYPEFPIKELKKVCPDLAKNLLAITTAKKIPLDMVFTSFLAYANHPVQMGWQADYNGFKTNVSTFTFVIAKRGAGKSTVDKIMSVAQKDFIKQLIEKQERVDELWEKKEKIKTHLTLQRKSLDEIDQALADKNLGDIKKSLYPHVVSGNITPEGVERAIKNGYPFHSVFSQEGAKFFGGYSNSRDNHSKTISELSLYKDGSLEINTVAKSFTEESSKYAKNKENIAFSMHLSMQPNVFSTLISKGSAEDQGFFSRTLVCKPLPLTLESKLIGGKTREQKKEEKLKKEEAESFFAENIKALYRTLPFQTEDNREHRKIYFKELVVPEELEWIVEEFSDFFAPHTMEDSYFTETVGLMIRRVEHFLTIAATLQLFRNPHAYFFTKDILILSAKLFEFYASQQFKAIHEAFPKEKRDFLDEAEEENFMFFLRKALIKKYGEIPEKFEIRCRYFRGIKREYQKRNLLDEAVEQAVNDEILDFKSGLYSFTGKQQKFMSNTFPSFDITPYFEREHVTCLPEEYKEEDNLEEDEDAVILEEEETVNLEASVTSMESYKKSTRPYLKVLPPVDLTPIKETLVDVLKKHGITLNKDNKALCPFHKEKTPSFSVKDNRYKCFGCDASGDVFDLIQGMEGKSFGEVIKESGGDKPFTATPSDYKDTKVSEATQEEKSILRKKDILRQEPPVKEIWNEAKLEYPLKNLRPYLETRFGEAIDSKFALTGEIKFHPSLYLDGKNVPAMVGAIRNHEGKLIGVHRTFLRPDLRDTLRDENGKRIKKILGQMKGGHVFIHSFGAGDERVIILCEGLETAMGLQILFNREKAFKALVTGKTVSILACLNADNLCHQSLSASHIIIAADNDETGRRKAEIAKDVYSNSAKKVEVIFPPNEGEDFADYAWGHRLIQIKM